MKKSDEVLQIYNPFTEYCRMEAYIDEEDDLVIKAELRPEFKNPYGFAHGGFLATIADNAAGYAAARYIESPVTISSSLNYLSNTNAGIIYGSAKPVRTGHKIVVMHVRLYSEDKTLLADGDFTYYNVGKRLEKM